MKLKDILNETPDRPGSFKLNSSVFNGVMHDEARAVTFCATKDWIIHGFVSAQVYHGTISSLLNEAAIVAIEQLGPNWITKTDSMMPFIQKVYEKRPGLEYMMHIIGDVKTDYFKNLVYDCGTLDITGRELGLLNGRLWVNEKLLSFWETDDIVKQNVPIIYPLLKEYKLKPENIKMDLQSYLDRADFSKDDIVTLQQFVESEPSDSKLSDQLMFQLNVIKKRLHDEPSKQPQVRKQIKQLLSKHVNTQDIDVVVDKILDRMKGSEIEMNRAKKAGYDNVAAMKGARPVREHFSYMDLMESVYGISKNK